ncbi:MAG: riboflavin biosynthesis protein RibF [Planctomycetes bacterium]|nr:riboflavin biosynthesis protein RibF [Planctomycetota bacterium]
MQRHFLLQDARDDPLRTGERVATVGFFDGVHRGHLKILEALKAWAGEAGAEPVVVTFDRHPQAILGGHPPVPVVSLRHRLLLLERAGVSATLVLRFDRDLAAWPAERFAREVLIGALGARRLLLGFDGAIGKNRQGSYEYLRARQEELGIEVRRCEAEHSGGERVSSTLIRDALRRGDLRRAEELLGREYSILGRVVEGDRRGREIGFPTANLDIGEAAVLPRGVYFAGARLDPRGPEVEPLPAIVNVGGRPTFHGDDGRAQDEAFDPQRDTVEVHVLDFDGDLYGREIEVLIERRWRGERRFESVEDLVRQIHRDVAARRSFL